MTLVLIIYFIDTNVSKILSQHITNTRNESCFILYSFLILIFCNLVYILHSLHISIWIGRILREQEPYMDSEGLD